MHAQSMRQWGLHCRSPESNSVNRAATRTRMAAEPYITVDAYHMQALWQGKEWAKLCWARLGVASGGLTSSQSADHATQRLVPRCCRLTAERRGRRANMKKGGVDGCPSLWLARISCALEGQTGGWPAALGDAQRLHPSFHRVEPAWV